MKYRIEWQCLLTGIKDNGSWFQGKDKEKLEYTIQEMNKKYRNKIKHWLVQKD